MRICDKSERLDIGSAFPILRSFLSGSSQPLVKPGEGFFLHLQVKFDAVVHAGEEGGAQAAARKAAAADAFSVDVAPAAQVVEGALILGEEDAGPGGAGAEEGLGDHGLLFGGPGVVLGYFPRACGIFFSQAVEQDIGHVVVADCAAAEEEEVVDEHGVAAAGDFVGPAHVAVVFALMLGDEGVAAAGQADDFALAEVFAAPVVVQGEHGREFAPGLFGFEEDGLGGRAVGELPGEFFDVQAVVGVAFVGADPEAGAGVGLGEEFGDFGAAFAAPGGDGFELGVAEGELGGSGGDDVGGPFAVRA